MSWIENVKGEKMHAIIRIKPPTNFQREDIRLANQTIILSEQNNRIVAEVEAQNAYNSEVPLETIFQAHVAPTLDNFLRGINVNIFAYGSTGAGKSQVIEGNRKENGVIILYSTILFQELANKFVRSSGPESDIEDYKYEIKIQYAEIIDEGIIDLLGERKAGVRLFVEDDIWEGPLIRGALHLPIQNHDQLKEVLFKGLKNRDNTSDEFGKVTAKATSIFTIELFQSFRDKLIGEDVILRSKVCFLDLPGSEPLSEAKPDEVRIKQGSTLNKVIIAVSQLIKELSERKSDYVMYDTSTVTRLCKEQFGSNSINVGIFCLQHGDPKGSNQTLEVFKQALKIKCYPVINNENMLALLRQFRQEAKSSATAKQQELSNGDAAGIQQLFDLNREVNELKNQISNMHDDNSQLRQKLKQLTTKFQDLVRAKNELQTELIKSEEDKLEQARALIELEMQHVNLMKTYENEAYKANSSKLDNSDIGDAMKEEKALELIKELQTRLSSSLEEQREIDMEMMVLRKNFNEKLKELQQAQLKSENYSLELINVVNENKALHDEITKLYETGGSSSEQNKLLIEKCRKLEEDIIGKDEIIIFQRADIERLKVELMRFDVLGHQAKLDLDKEHMKFDKSMIPKQQPAPILEDNFKQERMAWESQKMELTHKVKSLQRRVGDDAERIKELEKSISELQGDNTKMQLQLDEMRAIYRNKLIQIHKLDPRDELVSTYQLKEREFSEAIETLRRKQKQQTLEIRSLRSYSRNLRYLAEDWAPIGQTLPDILQRDYPLIDEDDIIPQMQRDQEEEIKRLRKKNHNLEVELMNLKDKQPMDTSKLIMNELSNLKGSTMRPDSESSFRKERNDLQEENRRLVQMLKDAGKWDLVVMQKENARLSSMLKEYEQVGPQSGQSKNIQQKIAFYEQITRQLEREKTELMVKATVAEEQLLQMQGNITRMAQDYQKQINQLKKQKL